MSIDRNLWLQSFAFRNDPLPFPCPTCGTGRLCYKTQARGDKEELPLFFTTSPENHRKMARFEAASFAGSFIYLAVCERKECGELVCLCGDHEVATTLDARGLATEMYLLLKPSFIRPAPDIFRIPAQCKAVIRDEIRAAFQLYWCDAGACANRIRNAVELVLTDIRVPRFQKSKSKRRRLSLHERIKWFESKDRVLARSLMALKWLGNAGSHPAGQVSRDDVLDGFQILDHFLQEKYTQHAKVISKITREIIRRKGPRSKS